MKHEHKVLYDFCVKWLENNPYTVYGDYRDELSDKQIEALLDGNLEKFDELWWEVEINASDYADRDGHENELRQEIMRELDYDEEDLDEDGELHEIIKEAFTDAFIVDCSDLLQTCLRNTRGVHIVATLLDEHGEPYYFPQWENGDEQNEQLREILKDFVEDPDAAEAVYSNEVLKICGTIDLSDLYERLCNHARTSSGVDDFKMPTKIRVGPRDNDHALLHSGWQGSGSLGSIKFTREKIFACELVNDKLLRYGVDAVYGFTGQFWREHELDLVWSDEKEPENV